MLLHSNVLAKRKEQTMKKYYVLACCEVMEIGLPYRGWRWSKNVIADGDKPGCWEIKTNDYYLNRDGSRRGITAGVIHYSKDKELTGKFDTVEEAFRDLDFWNEEHTEEEVKQYLKKEV